MNIAITFYWNTFHDKSLLNLAIKLTKEHIRALEQLKSIC